MAVIEGKTLVYSPSRNSYKDKDKNSQDPLPGCRLANHQLSTQRVKIEDYNTHCDKIGIADQYIFIVRCHSCKSEWIELWRTSRWFIRNNKNSYNSTNSREDTTIEAKNY